MSVPIPARLESVRLRGERVLVRPVDPGDADAIFPLIHERDEVTRWLVWTGPVDRDELEEAYEVWNADGGNGVNYRMLIEACDGGPIEGPVGTISLRFDGHPFVGDVGYWVAEEAWNRGYATEANRLVAHLAFERLGALSMIAEVFVGNDASVRVLEKVGYRRERGASGTPLVERPTELDQPCWSLAMTRRDFERARGSWRPVEVRVEHAGPAPDSSAFGEG